jgi:hypothetical protein
MDFLDLIQAKRKVNYGTSEKPDIRDFKGKMTKYPYPWAFSVEITYGQAGKKMKEAHLARNEIEKQWEKFGKWLGHGSSLGVTGSCDVAVDFRNKIDVARAKRIAIDTMEKYGVSGRYYLHDLRQET